MSGGEEEGTKARNIIEEEVEETEGREMKGKGGEKMGNVCTREENRQLHSSEMKRREDKE